jgi:hypothetical protein
MSHARQETRSASSSRRASSLAHGFCFQIKTFAWPCGNTTKLTVVVFHCASDAGDAADGVAVLHYAELPSGAAIELVLTTMLINQGAQMNSMNPPQLSEPCARRDLRIGTVRKLMATAAAVLALAGCKQGDRDPTDITPSSTARGNTSGGGSTSDGKVSGATPMGQSSAPPQRETATRTGPGTPNPVHGGSMQGGGGSATTGTGAGGTGASGAGGGAGGSGAGTASIGSSGSSGGTGGTGADMSGGSGTPAPPIAPGTPHVSASGAASSGTTGIANAPGMAAGPNGRRGTSEIATTPQR